MPSRADSFLPTRRSLLTRLKDWDDQKGWKEFLDTYGGLVYGFALKAGLGPVDAEDILQETLISASKELPNFKYDPAIGSFKGWLMQITRRRIADHWRQKHPRTESSEFERFADKSGSGLENLWEVEWQESLIQAATERLKRRLTPKQFQMFDLYVLQEWPLEKIRTTLDVSAAQIYMAKYRANSFLKTEFSRLARGIF